MPTPITTSMSSHSSSDAGPGDAGRGLSLAGSPAASGAIAPTGGASSLGPLTVVNPEQRARVARANGSPSSATNVPVVADPRPLDSAILRTLFPAEYAVDPADEAPVSGLRLEHFEIQERIGIGGMGSVFRAVDLRLQRTVALKILSPSQSRDVSAVQRFQNEAQAAARLDHENIARVYYIGQDRGLQFIAFEYVVGVNIRDLIRTSGRLSPEEAVNYSLQIALALRHTTAARVVHRDIKPSNIIVASNGRAKLVDLGLARKLTAQGDADLTMAGTTLGTFDYISPEQARDPRNVDVRSDIYSLGCTLYHMLTGEPPYPEGTVLQKLLDHQGGLPPDPSQKNRHVPPNLSAVVRKMMASDPRRRYATPDDLQRDLMVVAAGLGMRGASPEGLIWDVSRSRMARFWEKHLGWMATAALLLVIVFALDRFPALGRKLSDPPEAPLAGGVAVPHSAAGDAVPNEGRPLAASPRGAGRPGVGTPPSDGETAIPGVLANRTGDGAAEDTLPRTPQGEGGFLVASGRAGDRAHPGPPSAGEPSASLILPPRVFNDIDLPLFAGNLPELGAGPHDPEEPSATGRVGNEPTSPAGDDRRPSPPTDGSTDRIADAARNPSSEPVPGRVEPDAGTKPTDLAGVSEPAGSRDPASPTPGPERPVKPAEAPLPIADVRPPAPTPAAISIVSSSGGEPRGYPTLEAACAEAEDGSIIELRFDGARTEPEKPLRIANRKITIRAGKGFRPVIDFALRETPNASAPSRMISINNGALELSQVELRFHVSETVLQKDGEGWSLFGLAGAEQVRLQGVAVTIVNPASRAVSLFELAPAPGQTMASKMGKMKMTPGGMSVESPRFDIRLSECFVRGEADLLAVRLTQGGQLDLEKSAVAIDGALLAVWGGSDMPTPEADLRLRLDHVTALVGNSLVRVDTGDVPREIVPIRVHARNNLVAARAVAPLVSMTGRTNAADFRRLFAWNGERNFYDQFETFWSIQSPQGGSDFDRYDFEGWKRAWSGSPDAAEIGASRGPVVWKGRWAARAAREVGVQDLELDPGALMGAAAGATDGNDAGADLARLPVPLTPSVK